MPGPKRQPAKPSVSHSTRSAPARSRKNVPAARKPAASPRARTRKSTGGVLHGIPTRRWSWNRLSIDRKLDIIGVVMALVGLVTLLSLFSPSHGAVSGWWVNTVRSFAGWGAWILPLVLVLGGIWLVLRNVERLPMLSAERVTGLILLYLNILSWMHLSSGGNFVTGKLGEGGGVVGAFFQQMTVGALGEPATFVVFAAWTIIAVALTLDVSVSEIFNFIQMALASLARRVNSRLEAERQQHDLQELQRSEHLRAIPELDANGRPKEEPVSSELPPDFRPMSTGALQQNSASAASGTQPRAAGGSSASAHGPAAAAGMPVAGSSAVGTPTGQPQTRAQRAAAAHAFPMPPWKLPDVTDILDPGGPDNTEANKDEESRRSKLIVETLNSFGCPVKVVTVNTGPTVTQFGVEPLYIETRNGRTRVRVSKIVSLADDLALALAAPRIRIQAPVPGRNYVGIEVPNLEISRVVLRDVMESEAFKKLKSPMRFAMGKDVSGHAKAFDMANMPHLLIAGTTGSGKSVLVNAILTCLLLNNTPNELRMILVDPKRVELTGYNGIPHLLAPVVVEAEQVVGALQWVQREMDARYHRFSQVGARNIVDYNAKNAPTLPYMLVLIDELADLMMLAPDETERSLSRLAQLARATGIHLVIATQRPSVDVVTGLIKANFPARVAFAVASNTDSRVIIDQPGAERLLGRGDMLFQAPDAPAPVRLQGVYVSDPEIQRLVEYWRQHAYEMRDTNLHTPTAIPVNMDMPLNAPLKQGPLFGGEDDRPADPMMNDAIKIVREEGRASISMLQRKMRIGYTRAARLVEALEAAGVIGPAQATSQVREVLDFGEQQNNAETENSVGAG